jgi:sec-independent protein translocase protein TatC
MSWLTKFFAFREKSDGDVIKPFLDHMEDLRWTLIKMGITLVISMVISFFFMKDLMWIIQQPMVKASPELVHKIVTRTIVEPFTVSLLLSFFAGITLALPFLSYYVISFVLPALSRQEKKYLFPGIFGSFVLFLAGTLISYYYILPQTLKFFYEYSMKMQVNILWEWKDYISFCAWLTIGFGLLCQVPIVMIGLALLGFINYPLLAKTRPYAVTVILILAAVVAPTPDPVTFLSLGAPIIILYEVCIWIVWLLDRRRKQAELTAPNDFTD